MPRYKALSTVILIAAAVIVSLNGGWWLLVLLLIPLFAWDLVRTLRPGAAIVNARFAEPGNHRVVLQVPGPQPILVIREIRRTTGRELLEAKKVMDDWPSIVAEGVSQESAELVADRLRKAGAKAIATPAEESF